MNNLKLIEMLWELTPRCNKNCKYCGSSGVMNKQKEVSKEIYDDIVNKILAYPPEEITLTGGEPSICSYFDETVEKLSKKMRVKIVSNGTIFSKDIKTLNRLSQIGYSINLEEDMENYRSNILPNWKDMFLIELPKKITMITNFGIHNIWSFQKLFDFFIESQFSVWQIQLTMGDYQLNETGIEYLKNKIKDCNINERFESLFFPKVKEGSDNKSLIVLSDNLQECHTCTAGLNSCSITYDGLVIPCLSERSWRKELRINGDLKKQTLEEIWEHSFKEKRFKDSGEACRDCIKYPECKKEIQLPEKNKTLPYIPPLKSSNPFDIPWGRMEVVAYGAASPRDMTFIYGAFSATDGISSSTSHSEGASTYSLYGVASHDLNNYSGTIYMNQSTFVGRMPERTDIPIEGATEQLRNGERDSTSQPQTDQTNH